MTNGGRPDRSRPAFRWELPVLFAAALGVRLLYLLLSGGLFAELQDRGTDDAYFHVSAMNILSGKGYNVETTDYPHVPERRREGGFHPLWSHAVFPPLYSMFLAGVYAVGGPSLVAVRLVQALLLALCACLVYGTGRVLFGLNVGRLSGVLAAVSPELIYPAQRHMKENLYMVLVALFLYLAVRFQARATSRRGVGAVAGMAVVAALAALTRSDLLLFLPLFVLWLLWLAWPRVRTGLRHAAVFAVVAGLILSAWGWRNERVLGRFMVSATGGSITLFAANNANAEGDYLYMPERPEAPADAGELALHTFYRSEGLAWIRAHPGDFLALLPKKLWGLWKIAPRAFVFTSQPFSVTVLGMVNNLLMLALVPVGLVVTARHWRRLLVVYGLMLQVHGVALIFFGNIRLRSQMTPYLLVLCACALLTLVQGRRAGSRCGEAMAL